MTPPRPAPRADPERIGAQLRRQLAGFTRTLQAHGFRVGLAETRDALRILASPMAEGPRSLAAAWRALFCATHSDWERFDAIFNAFWGERSRRVGRRASARPSRESTATPQRSDPGPTPAGRADTVTRAAEARADGTKGRAPRGPNGSLPVICGTSSMRRTSPKPMRSPSGWRAACGQGSSGAGNPSVAA